MRSRCIFLRVVSATVLTFAAAGCLLSASAAADDGPIKVGFFAPQTGFGAPDGRSAEAGARLAVTQVNAAGGVNGRKIELVAYDDGTDPKQGATIATKLISQDEVAAAVSGSYSPQTLAAATIFQRSRVPLVAAYAINPGIPKTGDYVFLQDVDGVIQGRAAAHILAGKGVKNPAVISCDNDFCNALAKGFTDEAPRLGLKVVSTDKNQFGEKDFSPVIRRALAAGADAIYLVEYVGEGKQFLRDWAQVGGKLPILSTEGIDSAAFFSIGKPADGLMFTTNLNRDSSNPATRQFLAKFAKTYDFPVDMVAASSHDAVMLVVEAMRQKGTTPADIQAGLVGLRNFKGATGTISRFTDKGEVVKPIQLQIFKDGKIRSAGMIDDPAIITP